MKKNKILFILFLVFNSFLVLAVSTKEKIVSEKIILVGNYSPPKKGQPVLVLLHGLGSVRGEWEKLTKILDNFGIGYFLFDLRGHGESNKTISGQQVNFTEFKKPGPGSEWDKMVKDLDVVIKYLVKEKNVKEENIILCGASLGANICLIYGSKNRNIKNLILLSAGWDYAGLKTEPAAKKVVNNHNNKLRILFAASFMDSYAYSSTRQLINILKSGNVEITFLEGKDAQHGVQMFDDEFLKKLLKWINETQK